MSYSVSVMPDQNPANTKESLLSQKQLKIFFSILSVVMLFHC